MDPLERRAAGLGPLLGDIPEGLFGEGFDVLSVRLDRFVEALAAELAASLSLQPGEYPGAGRLLRRRGWSEDGRWALEWLFETLELFGRAERTAGGWRLSADRGGAAAAELRESACAAAPEVTPAYDVLELAARGLPAVLDGSRRGEDILFGPATMGLWFEYFSNANPHYAVSNALVALAAGRVLPARAAILEVGGGGGSAAEAVLGALGAGGRPPRRYLFTELQPAFLRRGARAVQAAAPPGCEVESHRFDVNDAPDSLGVAPGSFDAVIAVNTLHLAGDVAGALRRLASVLAPGGALVLGELIRPSEGGAVHVELPFTLLESFRRTPLDPLIRPRPGFLTLAGWREAFRQAGLDAPAVVPVEFERCQEAYPGFYGAALLATA